MMQLPLNFAAFDLNYSIGVQHCFKRSKNGFMHYYIGLGILHKVRLFPGKSTFLFLQRKVCLYYGFEVAGVWTLEMCCRLPTYV
jgi:hypothetical protein